jgi:hypothetical protein
MDDFWSRLADGLIPFVALPETIDPSLVTADMQRLWEAAVKESTKGPWREQVATIVLEAEENVRFIHELAGQHDRVRAVLDVGSGQRLIGIFHTHALWPLEPHLGVGCGPEDIVGMIKDRYALSLLRSGPLVCALVRTDRTVEDLRLADVVAQFQVGVEAWYAQEQSLCRAILRAGIDLARAAGLAYYAGTAGDVLWKM